MRRPAAGLQDFLSGKLSTLQEVAQPLSLPRSWLISGASDILELANPNFAQKQKIIRNLTKMDADFILVDLGAGSDSHVTDFYAAFPYGIIVTDGLPTSIENAYGFLKNGVLRALARLFPGVPELQMRIKRFADPKTGKSFATMGELLDGMKTEFPGEVRMMRAWLQERRTFLVLNMVKDPEDVKIGERFVEMVKKYLAINMHYIGYILFSSEVRKSIKMMRPLVECDSDARTSECFAAITHNLIVLTKGQS
jgi:flagellar biosynthesis protein FlhG